MNNARNLTHFSPMDASQAAALVREFQSGNKEAFTVLYDHFVKPIYNFIFYKTHHRETAEDLTSQTFLKAYRAVASFDEAKGTFSAWLYQIARRNVIDFYRSSKPAQNIDDVWDLKSEEDVLKDTGDRMALEKVREYLKELTAEQREIVLLRVWEEKSYSEIAEIIGKSENSCKMMFSRTIRKLRENIPEIVLCLALVLLFKISNS